MENIFKNLLKNEDTFTDGLVNMLYFSKEFKDNFFKLLKDSLGDIEFDKCSITTQVFIDGKIPDVVIEMGKAVLFIEVKIENRTGLQFVQEQLYKNCFKSDKYKGKEPYFLFLVPKGYPKRNELEKIINENSTEIKTGIENGIKAEIIHWEQIIEQCFKPILGDDKACDKGVETVEMFILKQYRELLKEKLNIMDIKFEIEEKEMFENSKMISTHIKLYWLPQQIKIQKSNWKFTINGDKSAIKLWIDGSNSSGTSIGFIIKNNGDGKRLSDYFEIRVWNEKISEKVVEEYKLEPPEKGDGENEFCYKFSHESIKDSDELSQQLIEILEKIMEERNPKKD